LSRLKWVAEKLADIVVDIIAGVALYFILGGYLSRPLSEISPTLPSLLSVTLVLAIFVGFFYRFFKSVKFHRFIEHTAFELLEFLQKWNLLYEEYTKAIESQSTKEFEENRLLLLYKYPQIKSALSGMSLTIIDPLLGITINNYDVIGNLLGKSPFVGRERFHDYGGQNFGEKWDNGRTALVSAIGRLDKIREGLIHRFYLRLHLVPFREIETK